jgi:hypothetical protein
MKNFSALPLPVSFAADRLRADLSLVEPSEWISHYRNDHYVGDWAVAPLRSVGGHPAVIYATPAGGNADFYQDTPLLQRCACFQEVIAWFQCSVNAARLMRLGPGARILEHTDDMATGSDEEWRIHLPVQTHPLVEFWVAGRVVPMGVGEVWYADFNLPHRVDNFSDQDRVHLVLDCTPNDWLSNQLEQARQLVKPI